MSKRARRILVTLAVCIFAGLIVLTAFYGKSRPDRLGRADTSSTKAVQPPATPPSAAQSATDAAATPASATPPSATPPNATLPNATPQTGATQAAATQADASGGATQPASTAPASAPAPAPTSVPATIYRAVAAGNDIGPRDQPPTALGSLDPRRDALRVVLSRFGAGIERIEFANLWQTARARRQAERYLDEIGSSAALDPSRMPQSERYVLAERTPSKAFDPLSQQWLYSGVPVMAASFLYVNGATVDLLNDDFWSETAPGEFRSRIIDADGKDVALVTRRYRLTAGGYDLALEQRVFNLSSANLEIRWQQYGPVDLREDATGYIPRRRLHFGYLPDPKNRPTLVLADDNHVIERSAAIKTVVKSRQDPDPLKALEMRTLWPTADTQAAGYGMAWFGSTNRYFGLAVHPPFRDGAPAAYSLADAIENVEIDVSNAGLANETLYSILRSPTVTVAPGAERAFDAGIYAGPLDRHQLAEGPYGTLSMSGMIIYSMSGCCTFLTFQWLAHLLLWFLSFLHDYVFFDWGLAIIGLVIVVRTLLHPITKRSQVNMMRFGKQMQALKPEIDKLQKKFAGDPKRLQQEQMQLWREHGVNPVTGALGCLPMFLQMPIWIALWASLYLAFDLQQQPAFYGVFQWLTADAWPFLSDLSSPDWFIPLGKGFAIPLVGWHIDAINLLPLLMGLVFFIQQKYMTPPSTGNMTPEQIQQQKIMKWMTVVLFPLMMYKSPSGLTLYIMTSSIIGILESRYVRRHIDQMDLKVGPAAAGGGTPGKTAKPKDALGRAWKERLAAIRDKQRQAKQEQRSFKKRK